MEKVTRFGIIKTFIMKKLSTLFLRIWLSESDVAFLAVLWILRCLNCEGERGPSNMFDLVIHTSSGHKKVSLMTVKIIYNFITFSLIAYGLSFSISLSFLEWIQFLSHTSGKKKIQFLSSVLACFFRWILCTYISI